MNDLSLYLLSYILLLTFGSVILLYLVPRDYLKHSKLSPLMAFLQAVLFFVYGGFPYLYLPRDWPAVFVAPWILAIGALLIFIGLAFLFYGMFRLGFARSLGRGKSQLAQSDIYSASRNPQAIACGLYVIGFLMLWPSWYAVGWALLYFVLIHMMILAEEKNLERIHGQKYQDHREEVPRYFGLNTILRRNPYLAALLSFFVPGLGQIYIGESLRGGGMLFTSIVIGSNHIIWLSIHSLASTNTNAFWAAILPTILHKVFAFWSLLFWLWIIIDSFQLAKLTKLQNTD